MPANLKPQLYVHELRDDLIFVSDSQDVQPIKDHIGTEAREFDSFFVEVGDGDYKKVYGMHGIVPLRSKPVWCLIFDGKDATL